MFHGHFSIGRLRATVWWGMLFLGFCVQLCCRTMVYPRILGPFVVSENSSKNIGALHFSATRPPSLPIMLFTRRCLRSSLTLVRHERIAFTTVRKFSTEDKVGNTTAGQAMKKTTSALMDLSVTDIHHKANIGLAVLTPAAFLLSPSILNYPVDLAMGVMIPVHSHVCLNLVAEDYVPRGTARSTVKLGIALVTLVTAFGIMKINMCGPGITESIKSLWRKPKTE